MKKVLNSISFKVLNISKDYKFILSDIVDELIYTQLNKQKLK